MDADTPTLDAALERRRARYDAERPGNQRRHAERYALLADIKVRRCCADCGYNAHPAALQFDHLDPLLKSFRIAGSLSRSWAVVLAEIAKCDVVCANCHAIRTVEQFRKGLINNGRRRRS